MATLREGRHPGFTRIRQAIAPFVREQAGSALVEFAMTAILLLMVIFGIMDCSRALYIDHFVVTAARDATRYSMVRGASWNSSCSTATAYDCVASGSNVSSFVQTLASPGVNTANLTTITTWPGTTVTGAACTTSGAQNSAGCVVMVKVMYSFSFVLPFLPKKAFVLSSTSEVTIAQ